MTLVLITFMDLIFQHPVALSIELVSARLRWITERKSVDKERLLFAHFIMLTFSYYVSKVYE